VATVVAKLLIAVAPDVALFGEKDFQQLAVVRRLVRDLALPVRVESIATVRDPDGLALSSRNAYLSADQRARALVLPRALRAASDALRDGVPVAEALEDARRSLKAAGFAPIDYVALVDGETLEPVEHPGPGQRLIAAATIGTTRLIDNLELQSSAPEG
jgi:pantoate--beta-alanine ligase